MKENLFGAGLALSVLFLVTFPATGNAEEQKEVLYTSPSGGLRIERNGEKAWVTSTKNPDQRAELPPLEGISPFDDEFHASPNEEWIFGTRKMAHGFSNGDLFHRVDPQHVEIAPTQEDQSFNDRVWPYCVKQSALKANYSAEEDGADTGLTDFVAWSLDSNRLLVQLRGGDRHKTLHACYVYFNTRTRTFEMTDYLRKLNKKYADVIAQSEKDRVSLVREAQRNWIKHRDEGARFYVSLFPEAEKERRRLQLLGDVTAARIEVPPEQWEL